MCYLRSCKEQYRIPDEPEFQTDLEMDNWQPYLV